MGFTFNVNKNTFKTQVTRKQALFNRMKRRFQVTNNASEKRFLKNEAAKIVKELKQFATQWKACHFGKNTNWITKNFTVGKFVGVKSNRRTKSNRKSQARRHTARRANVRRTKRNYSRRTSRGNKARRTGTWSRSSRRTHSRNSRRTNRVNRVRRSYVAW